MDTCLGAPISLCPTTLAMWTEREEMVSSTRVRWQSLAFSGRNFSIIYGAFERWAENVFHDVALHVAKVDHALVLKSPELYPNKGWITPQNCTCVMAKEVLEAWPESQRPNPWIPRTTTWGK